MLKENNISIKPINAFLVYPIVILLGQKVIFLGLLILEKKLRAILKLEFFLNLRKPKTYLALTKWLCNYNLYYAEIAKPLQNQKIELLSQASKSENLYQLFALQTKVHNPTACKLAFLKTI